LLKKAIQDLQKCVSKEWLSSARTHAWWLKKKGLRAQRGLELLLHNLEDEMTLVDFLSKEIT
jgi:hypothetical protein